jgi:hypothetical protein
MSRKASGRDDHEYVQTIAVFQQIQLLSLIRNRKSATLSLPGQHHRALDQTSACPRRHGLTLAGTITMAVERGQQNSAYSTNVVNNYERRKKAHPLGWAFSGRLKIKPG